MSNTIKKDKKLDWDNIADIYQQETGRNARIRPMDTVYDWAVKNKKLFKVNKDTTVELLENYSIKD